MLKSLNEKPTSVQDSKRIKAHNEQIIEKLIRERETSIDDQI
jgi:hypothetical protein